MEEDVNSMNLDDNKYILTIVGKLLRRKEGNTIKSEVAVAWSLSDSGFNTSNENFVNAIVNVQ
jgi:hypothetical protein